MHNTLIQINVHFPTLNHHHESFYKPLCISTSISDLNHIIWLSFDLTLILKDHTRVVAGFSFLTKNDIHALQLTFLDLFFLRLQAATGFFFLFPYGMKIRKQKPVRLV